MHRPMAAAAAAAAVAAAVVRLAAAANAVLVNSGGFKGEWTVPWYFDCRHSREWSDFREALVEASSSNAFREDLFWWAHQLLEKTEPIFLKCQNSKHMFYLCDPDYTQEPKQLSYAEDRESVFNKSGGTDSWSEDERERISLRVQDFCYYGYMAALAYRTRLLDSEVAGVLEGRDTAMALLRSLLMARSNAVDFLDTSGWAIDHKGLLRHLFPPRGPQVPTLDPEETLDDTELPLMRALGPASPWGLDIPAGRERSMSIAAERQPRPTTVRVAVLGYHTSLALELVSLWTQYLDDEFRFEVAGHILEPGAATAEENAKGSLCRDFQNGEFCAWDARLLWLNRRHVGRGRLPMAGLPSPRIRDLDAFLSEFAVIFQLGDRGEAALADFGLPPDAVVDRRIDAADFFVCTEPAVLCGAVSRAFPARPAIGYFANPLGSYLSTQSVDAWLAEFGALVRWGAAAARGVQAGDVGGRTAPFLAAASTRFLAEQMHVQSGTPVLTVRPLALYLGPPRGLPIHRAGEVLVLRVPSVFWLAPCILNTLVRLNSERLAALRASGVGRGIASTSLRFVASEDLKDGGSEAFAGFEASVVFPYDVSQMRLYEFYALAIPILLPSRAQLPSYLYRGLTSIDDFNRALPGAREAARAQSRTGPGAAHLEYDPFDRHNWHAVATWSQLTHWFTLPHLVYFDSVAECLLTLARDDLRPVSAGMRQRQARDLIRAVDFWRAALGGMGLR